MNKRVDKFIVIWTINTDVYMLQEIEDISELKTKVESNSSMPAELFSVSLQLKNKLFT